MFRELRKFEGELLDEAQSLSIKSGLDYSNPNSNNIEELFAAAAKLKCYLFNNITTAKDRWNALRHSLPTAQLRSILGTMTLLGLIVEIGFLYTIIVYSIKYCSYFQRFFLRYIILIKIIKNC
jgi:hypothetical protein